MKVLIVFAHEEPRSFNAAMKDMAVETLEQAGHSVVVSDLYAMKFKAVADGEDFLERRDKHFLKRQLEENIASELGTLAHDILEEQRKLKECDLLILQFPLWWFSMPAIMKGWVDRVLTMGFAYGGGKWYDQGGLKGKRAMLAVTTGGPEPGYSPRGINGSIEEVLFPIQHGILFFCGCEVLRPFLAWSPAHLEEAARTALLEQYRQHLVGIESLDRVPFHPLAHYDKGMQLRPEFTP
jgi:NAD(P)H dehydrogenase (quinone)